MPATLAFDRSDYPDRRPPERRAEERVEVEKQARNLIRLATDVQRRRRLVEKIRKRRANTPDSVRLESVRRENALDLVVESGRLVIRARDLAAARDRLERDFEITPPPPGGARIVGLDARTAAARAGGTAALAARMRRQGIPVDVNHVLPLGPYMKGDGGPEPSTGGRGFPAFRIVENGPRPVVAVLDTGISGEIRDDKYLAMTVAPADLDPLDAFPAGGDGFLDAGAGHGAFVTGVVQQVAPTAAVHIHRVADSDGVTTDIRVAEAMRHAVAQGAQILNLSLGTETVDGIAPQALLDVVEELAASRPDVLIVCAAGNGAGTNPMWPAAFADRTGTVSRHFPNVVAVAALDPAGDAAAWSTRGAWVTCSAIGEGVVSTYVQGEEDGALIEDPQPDTFPANAWAAWSGTSFAAPQIAGSVARIINESAAPLTPRQALDVLLSRGSDVPDYGKALEILPGT